MSEIVLGDIQVPLPRLASVVGNAVIRCFKALNFPSQGGVVTYQDCHQQALLHIWEHRHKFDPRRGNGSWASWAWITSYRVTKRMLKKEIERGAKQVPVDDEYTLEGLLEDEKASRFPEVVVTLMAWEQAQRALPEKTRRLIELRLRGASLDETMKTLGYKYSGPMYNRLTRVRPYLREVLAG